MVGKDQIEIGDYTRRIVVAESGVQSVGDMAMCKANLQLATETVLSLYADAARLHEAVDRSRTVGQNAWDLHKTKDGKTTAPGGA